MRGPCTRNATRSARTGPPCAAAEQRAREAAGERARADLLRRNEPLIHLLQRLEDVTRRLHGARFARRPREERLHRAEHRRTAIAASSRRRRARIRRAGRGESIGVGAAPLRRGRSGRAPVWPMARSPPGSITSVAGATAAAPWRSAYRYTAGASVVKRRRCRCRRRRRRAAAHGSQREREDVREVLRLVASYVRLRAGGHEVPSPVIEDRRMQTSLPRPRRSTRDPAPSSAGSTRRVARQRAQVEPTRWRPRGAGSSSSISAAVRSVGRVAA